MWHVAILGAMAIAGVWFGRRRIREAGGDSASENDWRLSLFVAVTCLAALIFAGIIVWALST